MVQMLLIVALSVPQVACLRTRGSGVGWLRARIRTAAVTRPVLEPPPADRPARGAAVAEPPAAAQVPDSSAKEVDSKESEQGKKTARRLPRFYAQLELDELQSQQVLAIQARYADREAKLQEDLKQLQAEREQEFRQVLNRSQQRKLSQLQAARSS